jgi:uncharacterized damage-inducible protein DinB
MATGDWTVAFTKYACDKLRQDFEQVRRCATLLSEAEFWQRVNAHTNSAANLTLHLTGNVRQWVLAGLGGETLERDRPAEFAAPGPTPAAPLVGALMATVDAACGVIGELDAAALERTYEIQHYQVTGVVAVFHVVEHFAGHTGQIVHITKALRDVDLSLYDAQGRRMGAKVP